MKFANIFAFVFAALIAFASSAVGAVDYSPVKFIQAEDVHLGQFPIEKGRLSPARQAQLGLRPYALDADGLFFNHQQGGKFALKVMKKGTIVLVDKDGTARYEESCGNRLIDPASLTTKLVPPVVIDPPLVGPENKNPGPSTIDGLRDWVKTLPEPARLAAPALGWLAMLGLLTAAAILAFWGLSALFGAARHNINARGWHRANPVI